MNRLAARLLCCAILATTPLRAQVPADRFAGDVVALDGSTLRVRLHTGRAISVTLPDDAHISGRAVAEPTAIAPGTYVGTTAVTQPDGTLLASEVHIFPASMRGTGEGHRPVSSAPDSTMTNGSVATVADHWAARAMTLKYRGGEKVVTIPAGIPIVMVDAADRTLLVPSAHVVVYVRHRPDESLVANRVSVGLRGFVPPV